MQPHLLDTRDRSPLARLVALGVLLAVVVSAFLLIQGSRADASIADKQDQLADVRDKQGDVQAQISAANDQINALIGQVSEARQREEAAAQELHEQREPREAP